MSDNQTLLSNYRAEKSSACESLNEYNAKLKKLEIISDNFDSSGCIHNLESTRDAVQSYTPNSDWSGDREDDFIATRDDAKGGCDEYINQILDIKNRIDKEIESLRESCGTLNQLISICDSEISQLQSQQ
jgi:hypothetical protein